MDNKELREKIEEILDLVYDKGKVGLDKDRTLFYNGANLFAIVSSEIEKERAKIIEEIEVMGIVDDSMLFVEGDDWEGFKQELLKKKALDKGINENN